MALRKPATAATGAPFIGCLHDLTLPVLRPVAARLRLLAAPVDALRALLGDHAPGPLNTSAQGAAPALRIPASGQPGYLLGASARSQSGGALALLLAAAVRGYVLGLSLS